MELIAACKVCREKVVRAEGLGNRAIHRMLEHLQERHPAETVATALHIADVLRRFDVFRERTADALGRPPARARWRA